MFGFLKVLKPIGIIVLKTVIKEIFNAEFAFGPSQGKMKMGYVLDSVESVIGDQDKFKSLTVDIVELVNAIVEVLNQLGLLDDEPGADIADPQELMKSIFRVFQEAMDVLRHFQTV